MAKNPTQKRTDGACEDCLHFDNTRHLKDARTAHAGLCKRFCETTFLKDTCNQWLPNVLPDWETEILKTATIVEISKPQVKQLNLF